MALLDAVYCFCVLDQQGGINTRSKVPAHRLLNTRIPCASIKSDAGSKPVVSA